jgi:7-keto-8-aminopelargonate synthetase-like enzyme
MLGDARLASQMADEMLKRGIYVIGFSYPVVCSSIPSFLLTLNYFV